MKRILIIAAIIFAASGSNELMAIEEPKYKVLEKEGDFELRQYEPYIVAEVVISGSFEESSSQAFRILFRYIDGDNSARSKIAMTAPVSQQAAGEKISMTAPVSQQASGDDWIISFAMPSKFTMETIPVPDDNRIRIRLIEGQKFATVKYSGFWKKSNFEEKNTALEEWIRAKGLEIKGEALWARYNPPFTPWFLRRNEILIPVE